MKTILPIHHAILSGWIFLLFSGLLIVNPAFSQQSSRKLVPKGTNGAPFGYFEYLPTGYSPSSEKKPLIIYLHGAGELGNGTSDLTKMKQRALPKLLQNGKNVPFVVIAPQAPTWWSNHDLLPMLEWVKKTYNIDPGRIYLTGISMGGTKAWDFARKNPGKITALLPLGADSRYMAICNASSLPIWAFHGAKDAVYPAKAMTAAIYKLNNECSPKANPPAKGTVYSDHGHDDLWDHVYNVTHGHDIYKWMLQYRKGTTTSPTTNTPPVARAGADITITLPQNSVHIKGSGTDSDGSISKYWWSKISGPSGKMAYITSPTMYAYSLVEGTYEFELTVTDNKGATSKDRMKLYVKRSGSTGGTTVTQGLNYKYYEGNWTALPNFGSMHAKKTGKVSNVNLAPRNRNDYFGFVFDGYIKISTAGSYTFYTTSDDGSKVYINGQQVVNNDGTHGARERWGSIYLKAGSYPIKITYFERYGGETLLLNYSGPGISKRKVPDAVLSTGSTTSSTSTLALRTTAEADEAQEAEIEVSTLESVQLVNNPVSTGTLLITAAAEVELLEGDVMLYDSTGKRYHSYMKKNAAAQWAIETAHLNPGIYILLLQQQDGQVQRLRFIQQ